MTTDPSRDPWTGIGSAWRRIPAPTIPLAADQVAGIRRRLAILAALEVAAAVLLIGLGIEPIVEHGGLIATVAGSLLIAQGIAVAVLTAIMRRSALGLDRTTTTAYLAGRRRLLRRQLSLIRGLAGLLTAEAIALGLWIAVRAQSDSPPVMPKEQWWYLTLLTAFGMAGWLAWLRTKAVCALARITQAELARRNP
jgi:hypothetical protein